MAKKYDARAAVVDALAQAHAAGRAEALVAGVERMDISGHPVGLVLRPSGLLRSAMRDGA